jgi:hypothetical protein
MFSTKCWKSLVLLFIAVIEGIEILTALIFYFQIFKWPNSSFYFNFHTYSVLFIISTEVFICILKKVNSLNVQFAKNCIKINPTVSVCSGISFL